jgi:hypothetical protein
VKIKRKLIKELVREIDSVEMEMLTEKKEIIIVLCDGSRVVIILSLEKTERPSLKLVETG